MPRRPALRLLSALTVVGLALLGTPGAASALSAPVPAAPVVALAGGSTASVPAATVPSTCVAGVFCAGAASGDITPPITSPQWAYTARNCAEAVAAESSGFQYEPENHVEEGAAYLLGGGPSCVANRVGPDTELYAKTWPPSEGTYGRLLANAYVLDDGKGQRVAIVQADLGGIPGEVHTYVADHLADVGITRDHLLISATHTHGSVGAMWQNGGYAALGGDEYDPRVFYAVANGLITAITKAVSRLTPAKIGVEVGQIANANHNRSGSAWNLNPEAKNGSGDTQNAYRFVAMRVDTLAGVPLGLITNFSNHGVIVETFNYYLNGDQASETTRSVSAAIRAAAVADGVTFPADWQVVDALTNGAQGDITPEADNAGWNYDAYGYDGGLDRSPPFGQFAKMENGGDRQTPEALRLWRDLGSKLTSDVTIDARMDFVCWCGQGVENDPFDPYDDPKYDPIASCGEPSTTADDPSYRSTSREAILGTGDGACFPTTVYPAHHREQQLIVGTAPVSPHVARVQVIRINDIGLAAMPGEPTIQMGRRVERSVKAAANAVQAGLFKDVFVVGLANDYMSYMATTQEYEQYDYEGSFSLFGQQTGNALKQRLAHLGQLLASDVPVEPCTVERNCIEPPPTTELAIAPMATAPDVLAGTTQTQPASVQRFTGTTFSWIGGGPSAEWTQNDELVELQRQSGTSWQTVATDIDSTVPVHYDKCGAENHWTAYTDPTVDATPGTYRFHVTGHSALAPGQVTPYTLDSAPFTVAPYTYLTVVKDGDGVFHVGNPAPDPLANYRYRSKYDTSATVAGLGATFTVPVGQSRTIAPGEITDAFGNTNAQTITVSSTGVQAEPARAATEPTSPQLVCASAGQPNASVPETPWTPGFVLLAMAMAGLVIRRSRTARS
ncbi:MAG: neutral/alkaline non-lysosomal ceramidase N-terminal domain-containing protein [Frankiaceae bacterium]|nr:neutral/alkaline non-lysosomal ceramidase N-terminal domain-containing protein [Frankiaceae bacterium]